MAAPADATPAHAPAAPAPEGSCSFVGSPGSEFGRTARGGFRRRPHAACSGGSGGGGGGSIGGGGGGGAGGGAYAPARAPLRATPTAADGFALPGGGGGDANGGDGGGGGSGPFALRRSAPSLSAHEQDCAAAAASPAFAAAAAAAAADAGAAACLSPSGARLLACSEPSLFPPLPPPPPPPPPPPSSAGEVPLRGVSPSPPQAARFRCAGARPLPRSPLKPPPPTARAAAAAPPAPPPPPPPPPAKPLRAPFPPPFPVFSDDDSGFGNGGGGNNGCEPFDGRCDAFAPAAPRGRTTAAAATAAAAADDALGALLARVGAADAAAAASAAALPPGFSVVEASSFDQYPGLAALSSAFAAEDARVGPLPLRGPTGRSGRVALLLCPNGEPIGYALHFPNATPSWARAAPADAAAAASAPPRLAHLFVARPWRGRGLGTALAAAWREKWALSTRLFAVDSPNEGMAAVLRRLGCAAATQRSGHAATGVHYLHVRHDG